MHTLTEKCEEKKNTTHTLHSEKFATTNYTGTKTKIKKGAIAWSKKKSMQQMKEKRKI